MTESLEFEHWSRAEGSLALDVTSRGYNREAVYRTHRVLSTSHDIMVKGSRGESRSQIKSAKALRLPKCMYIPTSVLERNNRSHQHLLKTLGQISSPFQIQGPSTRIFCRLRAHFGLERCAILNQTRRLS